MIAAARKAALLADAQTRSLLIASSDSATQAERRAALVDAFSAWPKLARAMVALEEAAPNCAREGAERDAPFRDRAERAFFPVSTNCPSFCKQTL